MIVYGEPSGGRLDIAQAELSSLLEAAGQRVKATTAGSITTCEAGMLPPWVRERASFLNDVGELLWAGSSEGLAEGTKDLDVSRLSGMSFKVDAEGFGGEAKRYVNEAYGELVLSQAASSRVSLDRPDWVIRVVRRGGHGFVGMTKPKGRGKWVSCRRPRAPGFLQPSRPSSRSWPGHMVNLTAVPAGGTFLDPFSGTCSTVIEACLVGAYSLWVGRSTRRWSSAEGGT